jgi:hypothetical protein
MAEVTVALALLARRRVNRASPPAISSIIQATSLLDEIATALGKPSAAQVPIEAALEAIQECRVELARLQQEYHPNLVELHPEKDDPLREYEDWFRHRLSIIAG